MILKFSKAADVGVAEKERIIFDVTTDGDIGRYVVLKTRSIDEETFSSRPSDVIWLPDLEVKKGDLVILYTKDGTLKATANESGTSSHFVYWGKPAPILDTQKPKVVILSVQEWKSSNI